MAATRRRRTTRGTARIGAMDCRALGLDMIRLTPMRSLFRRAHLKGPPGGGLGEAHSPLRPQAPRQHRLGGVNVDSGLSWRCQIPGPSAFCCRRVVGGCDSSDRKVWLLLAGVAGLGETCRVDPCSLLRTMSCMCKGEAPGSRRNAAVRNSDPTKGSVTYLGLGFPSWTQVHKSTWAFLLFLQQSLVSVCFGFAFHRIAGIPYFGPRLDFLSNNNLLVDFIQDLGP
ncbi:hypothetical protein VTK26DRAFT_7424 [Humicola hyalothermophila]